MSVPKVSVNALRGNLYLLSRLPRKDGASGLKQARIPLGLSDTPANRKVAEKRRAYLQRQVEQGTFAWEDWTETASGITWRKAIDALYRKRVVMGRTGENTWAVNYFGRLRQLDMTKEVTPESVAAALNKYSRDQCSYKELYYLLKDICQLVSVSFPEVPVPTYSKSEIQDVPSDGQIVEFIRRCENPSFAWHLGMMATYGLRPLEALRCHFVDEKNRLLVHDDTKTGQRLVVPVLKEWVDLFDLRDERRREGPGLSQWMYNERKKIGMTCKPYAMRHSYAGRLWRMGGGRLDVYTAARLMGHDMAIHEKTYRAWIAPYTIAVAAEDAIQQNLKRIENAVLARFS